MKRNSDAFVKDVETGGLRLKLRDPRSDGAVLSCQEDAGIRLDRFSFEGNFFLFFSS